MRSKMQGLESTPGVREEMRRMEDGRRKREYN
jgi:hypothetical protein